MKQEKVKQEALIERFLMKELGQEKYTGIYEEQQKNLNLLIENIQGKTKNQRKTLIQSIYPRVALYQALCNDHQYADRAHELIRKYMYEVVGKQKHKSMLHMQTMPGFYYWFSHIFMIIMKKTDLQKSVTASGKNQFFVDITECLWHNACVESGCPELCQYFCGVDNITYGSLNKIGFTRTQTLGTGGEKCDFCFYKKEV